MPQGTICRNKGYVSGFTKLLQEGDAFLKCCSCENLNFRCSSFHILYCYSFKLLLVLALFWKKKLVRFYYRFRIYKIYDIRMSYFSNGLHVFREIMCVAQKNNWKFRIQLTRMVFAGRGYTSKVQYLSSFKCKIINYSLFTKTEHNAQTHSQNTAMYFN